MVTLRHNWNIFWQEWGEGDNFILWQQIFRYPKEIRTGDSRIIAILITVLLPVWSYLLQYFYNVNYDVIYAGSSAKSCCSFHLPYILAPRRHIFSSFVFPVISHFMSLYSFIFSFLYSFPPLSSFEKTWRVYNCTKVTGRVLHCESAVPGIRVQLSVKSR